MTSGKPSAVIGTLSIARRTAALLATAVLTVGMAGMAPRAAEQSSSSPTEEPYIEKVRFRENYQWKQGEVKWETEDRIGIESDGHVIPYRKSNLKELQRQKVPKKKYYLDQADEVDNTYTAEAYRKAIELCNKALDIDPDYQPAKERLEKYKGELERLLQLKKQEAEAELARKKVDVLTQMQEDLKSLKETVESLKDEREGPGNPDALAQLYSQMQQMGDNVAELRYEMRRLEDDIDDVYRNRYRDGSYFYYYRDRRNPYYFPYFRHDRKKDGDQNGDGGDGDGQQQPPQYKEPSGNWEKQRRQQ